MRIVFIGSGNIAWFFATRLYQKGHEIVQVYSRNRDHATALALATRAAVTDRLDEITKDATVYILAIKDDALAEVAAQISFQGKTVIHCAGAVSLDVLQQVSEHRAVIWALYSIRRHNLPGEDTVPLIVEAHTPESLQDALLLAEDISAKVLQTSLEERQIMHLNAVLANNFTNHLLSIVQQICTVHQLPFELLQPIIRQTLEQAGEVMPTESQTGPAIRRDEVTLEKHMELLSGHPAWQKIYAAMSRSIQNDHPLV